MERLCHRCNAPVPPQTLFCGECGAPQIRVATSEAAEEAPDTHIPQEIAAPFEATAGSPAPSVPIKDLGTPSIRPRITWSTALPKAAIAGFATVMLLMVFLSVLQSAGLVFLVVPLGGIFSTWLYARGKDAGEVWVGAGARIGAITGLFTFVIYGIIVAAQFSAQKGMVQETMRKAMEQAMVRNPNPQAQALVNQLMTPEGVATIITMAVVIFLFVFLIFGAIGGALGAAMMKNQKRV